MKGEVICAASLPLNLVEVSCLLGSSSRKKGKERTKEKQGGERGKSSSPPFFLGELI